MQPKCITYFRWTECRCRSVQVKKNLFSRSTSATSLILTSAWLPDWEKSRQFGSLSCFVQLSLPEGDAEFWGDFRKCQCRSVVVDWAFYGGEGTTFRMRLATYLRRLPATVVFGRNHASASTYSWGWRSVCDCVPSPALTGTSGVAGLVSLAG